MIVPKSSILSFWHSVFCYTLFSKWVFIRRWFDTNLLVVDSLLIILCLILYTYLIILYLNKTPNLRLESFIVHFVSSWSTFVADLTSRLQQHCPKSKKKRIVVMLPQAIIRNVRRHCRWMSSGLRTVTGLDKAPNISGSVFVSLYHSDTSPKKVTEAVWNGERNLTRIINEDCVWQSDTVQDIRASAPVFYVAALYVTLNTIIHTQQIPLSVTVVKSS